MGRTCLVNARPSPPPLELVEVFSFGAKTMSTLKTGLLFAALTALFLYCGNALAGTMGIWIALGFAIVMNFGSYWFSDKLVLAMTRAQPIDRMQAPELYSIVENLSHRAGLPMPKIYFVPDPSPNAFATGRDPEHAVVAVNQGLLRLLNSREIEGVLAHELAHVKHRDTLTMAMVATLAGAISSIGMMIRWGFLLGGRSERDNPLGALAVALLAPLGAMLIQLGISRSREYEADREGAEIAGSPIGLRNALVKLDSGVRVLPGHMPTNAAHMCIVNPFSGLGGLAGLFSTHPSVEERVKRLDAMRIT